MFQNRRRWLAAGMGIFLLSGFISWRVTRPVRWFGDRLMKGSGCSFTVGKAFWIPWRRLELQDVGLRVKGGGHLHLSRVNVRPVLASLPRGYLEARWDLGEVRLDPGSWNIQQPMAQEILGAEPVTTHGSAVLRVERNSLRLQRFSAEGPLLRLEGEGSFEEKGPLARLTVTGSLHRDLLQGMGLVFEEDKSVSSWEPFQFRLEGMLSRLSILFESSFHRLAIQPQGETRT